MSSPITSATRSAPAAVTDGTTSEALLACLDGDHLQLRRELMALLATPAFRRPAELDRNAYRALVLEWLRALAQRGYGRLAFPREYGGAGDLGAAIAVFETLSFHDLSLTVKFGVQYGLFGGSILQLGNADQHARYLRAVADLELPGCFAMTETGHGSNVRSIETVARYDAERDEIEVHTPTESARKDYIGNAALHGRMATVFAQLQVDGVEHGVHAVLVPLRDEDGRTLPGIRIEDCGAKMGLNGVDNGRIWFERVRVPRASLLDRFGRIDEEGRYTSDIASPGKRFFAMIGTLIAGRISIAAASNAAAKIGLTVAIRYTDRRRQFGPADGPEQPLLDYHLVQRRLLAGLARVYAFDFTLQDLARRISADPRNPEPDLETQAAALKVLASKNATELLRACREACGGSGYLAETRFAELIADTEVFMTFEGANDVLLQLVARALLTELKESMGELGVWGLVRLVAGQAASRFAEANPLVARRTDPEHLLDAEFHTAALDYRQQRRLIYLARGLKSRIDAGVDSFEALNELQDEAAGLGLAAAERMVLHRFLHAVHDAPAPLRPALSRLCTVYALDCIERDAAWFLEAGYLDGNKSRAIRDVLKTTLREVRTDAVVLVEGFGVPAPHG